MTKQEIQSICNNVYLKILKEDYTFESLQKKLTDVSTNGKMNLEGAIEFLFKENQEFTFKMVQNSLVEVLTAKESDSANSSTDI
ncbi:MAG: hypothetical protein E6342_00445 [Clostridium sp.]|uniref:hypothetical protein n=1 Tax=Clostridium sp. TaxID=1506 RepID=UPI0029126C48|nr:hypothetical protein [Clostridium sp.]MDU7086161.1 hypothetical protein [Clostridium sp.]